LVVTKVLAVKISLELHDVLKLMMKMKMSFREFLFFSSGFLFFFLFWGLRKRVSTWPV